MRPHGDSAHEHEPRHFSPVASHVSLITSHYLRYVLIRCLAYTNDRTLAGRIAAYTLIVSCQVADRLKRRADLGFVVDAIVRMVGEDQCRDLRSQMPDMRFVEEASAFVLDDRLCEVAGAINGVRRLGRELLILHHIEGLDAAALAELLAMSPRRVEKAMGRAERQFAEILSGMSSWGGDGPPDVHGVLNDLAGCVDAEWAGEIVACVLEYLAGHDG